MHNEKDYLTRVEGHGTINIDIKNGKIKKAEWQVIETPRFFEAMVVNKSYEDIPLIVSRICGICSIAHVTTSIRSIERAFDIKVSEKTAILRRILKNAETLQSHILHLYFLALPDFLNEDSVLPIVGKNPAAVERALRIKQLANDICDCIGGRTTHPVTMIVGGFTKFPDKNNILTLRNRLKESINDLVETSNIFSKLQIPEFERETEFVSLKGADIYPWIGGDLMSSDGVIKPENDYKEMTNEYMAEWSTSKLAKLSRKSFAVGALARINNNFHLLHDKAQEICKVFKLTPKCCNPFMNNIAQLVECFHVAYETIDLFDKILEMDLSVEKIVIKPKKSKAVGAVEAPRGILYHFNEINEKGRIIHSDYIIPTGQNHANIYDDLIKLVDDFSKKGYADNKIKLLCEMLVRSYDPCISCSVH
ncbi:Ni/Fe hydrogenase subunit alpha [Candidatus Poribacteria bacterium]|nr:Ni/Fe hydrogenase subunit alpha [Candidatus Poribacteria bacterium]